MCVCERESVSACVRVCALLFLLHVMCTAEWLLARLCCTDLQCLVSQLRKPVYLLLNAANSTGHGQHHGHLACLLCTAGLAAL